MYRGKKKLEVIMEIAARGTLGTIASVYRCVVLPVLRIVREQGGALPVLWPFPDFPTQAPQHPAQGQQDRFLLKGYTFLAVQQLLCVP